LTPTCLNYYPTLTKAFICCCKVLVCAHYATQNPFITLEAVTQGIGLETLGEVYIEYTNKCLALKDGQYPQHRHSMLYNKNGNFHSELKRITVDAVWMHYQELQVPKGTKWTSKQGIEYAKKAASWLLKNGDWLQGLPNRNGKLWNFSHDTIKYACLTFYNKPSSHVSFKTCKEFATTIPIHDVGLVVTAVCLVCVSWHVFCD
ncbi:hypothetical protein PAXRUDRAFT_165562, partial [Paxillus rubicundulus Ve08.2h10]